MNSAFVSSQRPVKFRDIMTANFDSGARRIAQIKLAEKTIRAIQSDLEALVARGFDYEIHEPSFSMHPSTIRAYGHDIQPMQLHATTSTMRDLIVRFLLGCGYTAQRVAVDGLESFVVLRRIYTRVCLVVYCSPILAQQLADQEAA